jgi:hypothetical protein
MAIFRRDGSVKVFRKMRILWIVASVVTMLGVCGAAGAFEIPTGNEDVKIRWDNTFRYTLTSRVEGQKDSIINNVNADDGDRNYNIGIVSSRLDLLSEADFIYKDNYGFRISGAAWYDPINTDQNLANTSAATSNHLVNGVSKVGWNDYNKRYYKGPDGELLDAFIFAKFDIAGMPLNLKAGRHTIFWGEAMGLAGTVHGVSYAQSPLDNAKGLAMPGVEAKELFRPLNNISFQIQPTSTLSIAGQYLLEWESNRLPEAGTYLGFSDLMMGGAESMIAGFNPAIGYLKAYKGRNIEPNGMRDWGVSTRWSPEWLEGTLGLYYRNFSDRFAQVHLRPGAVGAGVAANPALAALFDPSLTNMGIGKIGEYHLAFAQDIDLFGISFSRQILGVSVGAELSYRMDMPLASESVWILPAALTASKLGSIAAIPGEGQTGGARGDTWHAVLNFVGTISKTPLFDAASWAMEYVWSHVDHLTQGAAVYKGRDNYTGIDKPSSHYIGGAVSFTPIWFQVLPSVDLSMPLTIGAGLVGDSAVLMGGNENCGTYSFGFSADIFSKYRAELKYVGFYGDTRNDAGQNYTSGRGVLSMLSDRDMVVLTLKATF